MAEKDGEQNAGPSNEQTFLKLIGDVETRHKLAAYYAIGYIGNILAKHGCPSIEGELIIDELQLVLGAYKLNVEQFEQWVSTGSIPGNTISGDEWYEMLVAMDSTPEENWALPTDQDL